MTGMHICSTSSPCCTKQELCTKQVRVSSPPTQDSNGDGFLQLPGRGIDDITMYLQPLATHSRPVKDVHLLRDETSSKGKKSLSELRFCLNWTSSQIPATAQENYLLQTCQVESGPAGWERACHHSDPSGRKQVTSTRPEISVSQTGTAAVVDHTMSPLGSLENHSNTLSWKWSWKLLEPQVSTSGSFHTKSWPSDKLWQVHHTKNFWCIKWCARMLVHTFPS